MPTYDNPNTQTDWQVPQDVIAVDVRVVGGTGGGGDRGGPGGEVTGRIPVTAGEVLSLIVGESGGQPTPGQSPLGDGGAGGDGDIPGYGGGAPSGILRNGTELAIGAGGGGAASFETAFQINGGGGGGARGGLGGAGYHDGVDGSDAEGSGVGGDGGSGNGGAGEAGGTTVDTVVEDVTTTTSTDSPRVELTPIIPVVALRGLDASVPREITITYAAQTDGDDILVERSTDGGATWADAGTISDFSETEWTDTGLLDGERYTYRLTRQGVESDTQSATTVLPDATTPQLDNGVRDGVSYSVSDNTNNGDYRIQIRETGTTTWDNTAPGFAEDVTESDSDTSGDITGRFVGREDGEEYEVRARTETNHVTGAWTTPVSITTFYPGASDLSLSVISSTELRAEWVDNADNEDGLRVFLAEELDRRSDTGYGDFEEVADLAPNTTTYNLTGLAENTGYKVYIEAYTGDTTAQSETVTVSTGPDLTLAQSLTVGEGLNRIQLGLDEIVAKDLAKVHTGVGDARVSVPETDALIPNVQRQDRVNYYIDGECEWTGYAVGYQGDDLSGRWELRLDGIGKRLEETRPDYDSLGESLVYSNTALDDAIDDYWDRTPFSATVTDQETEIVAEDEELQSADTTSDWDAITGEVGDEVPLDTGGDEFGVSQSSWVNTASDIVVWATYTATLSTGQDGYVAGEHLLFDSVGEYAEFPITLDYTLSPDEFNNTHLRPAMRGVADGDAGANSALFDVQLDGTSFATVSVQDGEIEWADTTDTPDEELTPGTYTVRFEVLSFGNSGDSAFIDVLNVHDSRFDYTFDNTLSSPQGHLDGPQLYPQSVDGTLSPAPTAFNISGATVTTAMKDTIGPQAIAVSNDNGANFLESTNTATATFDFNTAGREAVVRFTLGRYGTRTGATPRTGFNGQAVQDYTLEVDLNDLVVIDRLELSRDHFANLKTLHDYGDFLWVIEHDDGDLSDLTVRSFNRGAETRTSPFAFLNPANRSPEVAAENYFNSVYLEGALQDDGTRPTAEVKDDDAIANDRDEITPGVLRDQNISTESGAQFRANALLQSALENNELRGTISTYPEYVSPGFAYEVTFGDSPDTKTLESVSITESAGDVQATYEFVTREQLADTISSLKREGRDLGNQV